MHVAEDSDVDFGFGSDGSQALQKGDVRFLGQTSGHSLIETNRSFGRESARER